MRGGYSRRRKCALESGALESGAATSRPDASYSGGLVRRRAFFGHWPGQLTM